MVYDHGDVFVLKEDPWEGFRESKESVERVLLDNEVGIVDQIVEMGESVDENGLDVLSVWVEAKTAKEQGAGLPFTWPSTADDS